MTTGQTPPIVPLDEPDEAQQEDSADADRVASQGGRPEEAGAPDGSDEDESSADADYSASMGEHVDG